MKLPQAEGPGLESLLVPFISCNYLSLCFGVVLFSLLVCLFIFLTEKQIKSCNAKRRRQREWQKHQHFSLEKNKNSFARAACNYSIVNTRFYVYCSLLEDLCTQSVITKKNTGSPIKPPKGLFKLDKKRMV